jgi:hypothetical protein
MYAIEIDLFLRCNGEGGCPHVVAPSYRTQVAGAGSVAYYK